eukprot:1438348-Prymnesium_polylepis.1
MSAVRLYARAQSVARRRASSQAVARADAAAPRRAEHQLPRALAAQGAVQVKRGPEANERRVAFVWPDVINAYRVLMCV